MQSMDDELIAALSLDGRMTTKKLAQRAGTSEAATSARLRQLIEANVIRVVAQQDASKDPPSTVKAMIELHLAEPGALAVVIDTLEAIEEVRIVYETARRPELCCHARATDMGVLRDIVARIACSSPAIAQISVLPLLGIHRSRRNIVNLEHSRPYRPRPTDIEGALIHELGIDARQPVSSLARKLGLSPTATRYRLEKLLADGRYNINLLRDAKAMGYAIWADLRITLRPQEVSCAIDRLAQHKDVISIAHLCGAANLMVFVVSRDVSDLDTFVREEIRSLPGMSGYEIMRVPKVAKYDYNLIYA